VFVAAEEHARLIAEASQVDGVNATADMAQSELVVAVARVCGCAVCGFVPGLCPGFGIRWSG
jgi:hypothetical protein